MSLTSMILILGGFIGFLLLTSKVLDQLSDEMEKES
jgi:hypothetical protein